MTTIQNKCTALLFLTFSFISFAQDSTFNLRREIQLHDYDSKEKTITLNVGSDTNQLYIMINCRVMKGSISIGIFSPSGEKKGDFEIESQFDETSKRTNEKETGIVEGRPTKTTTEIVEGRINKNIKTPEKGKWLIKIKPTNTNGVLQIDTKQFQDN
ncbi:hypothetical protein J4050_04925 [Winogradskyella sp. DF17]|jgi:hypothetical protein|uniref:YtkA-like domain-containing protein n=1 Tax=Winogradskyella pelagia TaxID=2819984 RepID=A0ABS3T014_9FLAO|nr:hypothetical protein [Winogradskyella sp. DF17]MBO3116077.1 hypothetical protein [Winogradskyella sp. DF17]